jgi:uncharacterized protein (DUF1499 family)
MFAIFRIAALVLLFVVVAFLLWVAFVNFTKRESSMWFGGRPSGLGVKEGKLTGPKQTPNSVVSEGIAQTHPAFIAPIPFTGPASAAMAKLLTILQATPDVTIIKADENYVHAEFRTPRMRYCDDFEARVDAINSMIQVRSASRVGKRDFDVNRNRVEMLRKTFLSTL